jgi:polyketide cyclase/dehydrase/lipid transport protein
MWVSEQSAGTSASPETIWRIWTDIPAWPVWNLDIDYAESDGPLVVGTIFTLGERGIGPVKGRITDVVDGQLFTVGFDLDGGMLSVTYRVAIWNESTRIYHRMVVEGPNDQEIGQQMASIVAERVPSILHALVRLAES